MTLKQERPEGTMVTQEASYVSMSSGDQTIIIKGCPSNFNTGASNATDADNNIYVLEEAQQTVTSREENFYKKLYNKIEYLDGIVKELQQDIQELKKRR